MGAEFELCVCSCLKLLPRGFRLNVKITNLRSIEAIWVRTRIETRVYKSQGQSKTLEPKYLRPNLHKSIQSCTWTTPEFTKMKIVLILTALTSLIGAAPMNDTLLTKDKAKTACSNFSALEKLSFSTVYLKNTITKWNGSQDGIHAVAEMFTHLPFDIESFANLTWSCPPVKSTEEALWAQQLETLFIVNTRAMLYTVSKAKEKFTELGLGIEVGRSLMKQRLACGKLLYGMMVCDYP
jgi:hypothetical protein